jgi:hypothetical protein
MTVSMAFRIVLSSATGLYGFGRVQVQPTRNGGFVPECSVTLVSQ